MTREELSMPVISVPSLPMKDLASWLANPDARQPSEVGILTVLQGQFGSVACVFAKNCIITRDYGS